LGGDGLHRRTVTHYPDPDAEDFRRVLAFSEPEYFWGILENHLEECDAIIKESEYEPRVYPSDGTADPFSEEWYSGQIGWRCNMLLNVRADGGKLPAVLLLYIMQIGALVKERHWRMSHLTRSSLHRCLQRHGISRLPDMEGDKPKRQKFKRYPIGYFHIRRPTVVCPANHER